ILAETLANPALEISAGDAARITAAVDETLAGEVTVERSDVMRGVGRALSEMGQTGSISARQAADLRIAAAAALVDSPPRADTVIVVRHTGQAELNWTASRDRWSHELTDAAGDTLLKAARDAGFDVADEAALLAL
ncbi:MAG: hypothetical protein P5702_26355, partial [Limnospira sp. PMC 1291.21]